MYKCSMNGIVNSKEIKFIVSYYSKPFSGDVGSIQIFSRISRLTDNLTKPLYTEPLSYKCNVNLNGRWIFSSFCYDMHAYQIKECLS
jgi:hypothetical protein